MSIKRTTTKRWGNNLRTQIAVDFQLPKGDKRNYKTKTVKHDVLGVKWKTKKEVFVGDKVRASNDDIATRTYRHTCGLKKLVLRRGGDGHVFALSLSGHADSRLNPEDVHFRFDPKRIKKHHTPVVIIRFRGDGPRNGPLKNYEAISARIIFHDHAQADKYLHLPGRKKMITYRGKRFYVRKNGSYRSDDGSILPYVALWYALAPWDARADFATGNYGLSQSFNAFDAGDHFSPGEGAFSGAGSVESFGGDMGGGGGGDGGGGGGD